MRFAKRSKRRLPSPLELLLYLFAVIAFCVVNWTLLKAVNPDKPAQKSVESVIVEAMLEDLGTESLPEDKEETRDEFTFAVPREQTMGIEPWMLDIESFSRFNTEAEIILEDWMINFATWSIPGSSE